jgi:O-antigen/teichoic acid export membrane protein
MGGSIISSKTRKPQMGRDSSWLIGSDLIAIFLALAGQIVLTKALLTQSYGIYIIALDAFATFFLIIDLGLPTLIARDGVNDVNKIWPSIIRVYRLQLICSIPFILLTIIGLPLLIDEWKEYIGLILVCGAIALVHIASYAPRSGLRAAGQAKLEAWSKVIERAITVTGYYALYLVGSSSVTAFAIVFLIGAIGGLVIAIGLSRSILPKFALSDISDWSNLGDSWVDNKTLLLQALPFAITLGVLPYVVRIEKFIVAGEIGVDAAALFHVAQLAWLAGLVVPQALRAALLPVLGEIRGEAVKFQSALENSLNMCLGLLPVGLFTGAGIVYFLLPLAFPEQYIDGSLGASAVELFMVLLAGWCLTLLSTPTYTALQAGEKPWKFTLFIGLVVLFALIIGYLLIDWGANKSQGTGLYAAAVASTISASFLLFLSIHLSSNWDLLLRKKKDFSIAILLSMISCYGFTTGSWIAISGIGLFYFIPQGIEAISPTVEPLSEE